MKTEQSLKLLQEPTTVRCDYCTHHVGAYTAPLKDTLYGTDVILCSWYCHRKLKAVWSPVPWFTRLYRRVVRKLVFKH